MASKSNVIRVPGKIPSQLPIGTPTSIFQKGVEAYEALPLGSEVELAFDDGSTRKAVVQSTQVGALIDMLTNFGPQSLYTYGQLYSPRTLIQTLATSSGEPVIDVTKLYTSISVVIPSN